MSAPLRFLGLAILAYVGLRTASSALALEPVTSPLAAPAAGTVASLPPAVPANMGPAGEPGYGPPYGYGYGYGPGPGYPPKAMAAPQQPYQLVPYPVPAMMPVPRYDQAYPQPAPHPSPRSVLQPDVELEAASFDYGGSQAPSLDQWPAIGTKGPFSAGSLQEIPSWGKSSARRAGLSRWSADAWALVRQPRSGLLPVNDPARGLNPGLAPAGSLGGSQAGLRLTYRPLPSLGLHVRTSTALMPQGRGGQTMAGGEGAAGVSFQPLSRLPIRLLAERRQRLGPALGGGRNAFPYWPKAAFPSMNWPMASSSTAMARPGWSAPAAATCSRTERSPRPTPSCPARPSAGVSGPGPSPACTASMPVPGSATSCRRGFAPTSTIASA